MRDKDFLQWLHDRLHYQHKLNADLDYMTKLQCIIDAYPKNKVTPNITKVEDNE